MLLVLIVLCKNILGRVHAFYKAVIHINIHELKMSHLSSDSSSTRCKAQSLNDLLHEFGPIKAYLTRHFSLNSTNLRKPSFLPLSLPNHTHLIILHCFLHVISFRRLLQIPIDIQIYIGYTQRKRGSASGQICLLKSFTCLLALLYI